MTHYTSIKIGDYYLNDTSLPTLRGFSGSLGLFGPNTYVAAVPLQAVSE